MIYESFSSEETKRLAAAFARRVRAAGRGKRASVVALSGELGAGKTTFTQGFVRGLGVRRRPASPTFVLWRRTALARGPFRGLYHVDAYRLGSASELSSLGFRDVLKDPSNMVLIEWPERVRRILPKGTLWVKLAHGRHLRHRRVQIPAKVNKRIR